MNLVSANEIFGKNSFDSYSEFNLALAIAKCLSVYGKSLDMSRMIVDKSILPDTLVHQFKHLIHEGYIYIEGLEAAKVDDYALKADIDVSYFNDIPLYERRDNKCHWSFSWVDSNYGSHLREFTVFNKLGYSILHVVAMFIIRRRLGVEKSEVLEIDIDSQMAKNKFMYLNIYSCRKTLSWFNEEVLLEVHFSGRVPSDLDYDVFCNNSYMSRRYKNYTIAEKLGIIKDLGIEVGSILVLWTRKGMCENSIFGVLKSAIIVRLDEIGDDFLGFSSIALNKTREEIYAEYYDIDPDKRYLFSDILDKDVYARINVMSLSNIGIEGYFKDEDNILTKLDKSERVVKYVSIFGEKKSLEMSGVDAIYWLLSQYNIEFDRELYKSMYSDGKEFLWDLNEKYNMSHGD